MKRIGIILLITFIVGECSIAQTQPLSVHDRMMRNSSAMENDLFSLVYNNPAMKSRLHTQTLTTLQLDGEYQDEDLPALVQEGNGIRMGTIDVKSFIQKQNKSLWGQAFYKNGKKLGRCWNETSDFALLYPYVMGDTIGGDLKSEQYFFSGGYAYKSSSYIIGVEGSYKATIEYRNTDPRPKNLTGDLYVSIGAAKSLLQHYLLGVSGYARKYKQTNDLVFYNELGVPNIYHFTGLGTDYYRFRGAKGESFYKGHVFGGSIELLTTSPTGLGAAFGYQRFQFDKVISSLNELPMAAVKEDQLKGEVAWKQEDRSTHSWGIKGNLDYTRRIGSENIFGTSSGNIFNQINTQEKFMNKIYSGNLAGVYEFTSSNQWRVSVLPALSYTDIQATYIYPQRYMEVSFFSTKIDFRMAYQVDKWLLNSEIGWFGKFSNNTELNLLQKQQSKEEKMNTPVASNFEALKANHNGFHATLRGDYSWNQKYSIYLGLNYIYTKDQRHSVFRNVNAQIGFAF